ncbi:(d)CMP kinase [Soehngenia longivitae]|uniref:Cytidylate kinase n=1 Tax=Soehngenia longivitae TaxID=2562294 RepID=A0A4Z0D2K8_9FIRM|nr:(d)CMP kinase [Soehngenia longivitae]TFZ39777.1 (d)CMP kinase [Soehngenia longivitae]
MDKTLLSIAIDGPAGAGKSTVAKKIAKKLNLEYIDTGAMYRAFTLKVLENGLDPKNENEVLSLLENTEIIFLNNHIYLDGKIVDEEIRNNSVSKNVSYVSSYSEVRKKMVELQQEMAKKNNVIMDGRDIGTVVLPNASYKFFITAQPEERGKRRYMELIEKGETDIILADIIDDINKRDKIDSTRKESPLRIPDDAIVIDSTNLTVDEVVDLIIELIKGVNKIVL